MYVCMYVSSDLVIQIRLYFHRCSCQKKRRASPISPCQRLSEVPTESESILLHKTCNFCLPVNSIYVYVTIYMRYGILYCTVLYIHRAGTVKDCISKDIQYINFNSYVLLPIEQLRLLKQQPGPSI